MSFTNIKAEIFKLILTWDRRYNTFDLKRIMKHYIEGLIFKTIRNLKYLNQF